MFCELYIRLPPHFRIRLTVLRTVRINLYAFSFRSRPPVSNNVIISTVRSNNANRFLVVCVVMTCDRCRRYFIKTPRWLETVLSAGLPALSTSAHGRRVFWWGDRFFFYSIQFGTGPQDRQRIIPRHDAGTGSPCSTHDVSRADRFSQWLVAAKQPSDGDETLCAP